MPSFINDIADCFAGEIDGGNLRGGVRRCCVADGL